MNQKGSRAVAVALEGQRPVGLAGGPVHGRILAYVRPLRQPRSMGLAAVVLRRKKPVPVALFRSNRAELIRQSGPHPS